jgi:hypothetical protein
MKKIHALVLGASVLLLAACGSSSNDSTPVTPTDNASDIPTSALSSASGFVAYVMSLIDGTSNTSDPVAIGDVSVPTDNTTETSL